MASTATELVTVNNHRVSAQDCSKQADILMKLAEQAGSQLQHGRCRYLASAAKAARKAAEAEEKA